MRLYLLDTSAVIAHAFLEKGHIEVQALFDDPAATVMLAAPALLELDGFLCRRRLAMTERNRVASVYENVISIIVPADRDVVRSAIRLREAATERLPAMDALIAGCALVKGAILVHRDTHYDSIPSALLTSWNILKPPAYDAGSSRNEMVR